MLIVCQICDGRRADPCVSSRAHLHTLAVSLFWLRLRHKLLLPTSLLILLWSSSELREFRHAPTYWAELLQCDVMTLLISEWGDFISCDPGPARWHCPCQHYTAHTCSHSESRGLKQVTVMFSTNLILTSSLSCYFCTLFDPLDIWNGKKQCSFIFSQL